MLFLFDYEVILWEMVESREVRTLQCVRLHSLRLKRSLLVQLWIVLLCLNLKILKCYLNNTPRQSVFNRMIVLQPKLEVSTPIFTSIVGIANYASSLLVFFNIFYSITLRYKFLVLSSIISARQHCTSSLKYHDNNIVKPLRTSLYWSFERHTSLILSMSLVRGNISKLSSASIVNILKEDSYIARYHLLLNSTPWIFSLHTNSHILAITFSLAWQSLAIAHIHTTAISVMRTCLYFIYIRIILIS